MLTRQCLQLLILVISLAYSPPPPQIYKSVTCQEINADATVPANTKVELNSIGGSVTLNPNFTVETGAELEINILP